MEKTKFNRREFLKTVGIGAAVLTLPTWMTSCNSKKKQPNILFIFSDDHALQAISAYGSKIKQYSCN